MVMAGILPDAYLNSCPRRVFLLSSLKLSANLFQRPVACEACSPMTTCKDDFSASVTYTYAYSMHIQMHSHIYVYFYVY